MEKLKHLIGCLKPHEVQLAEQYFKLKTSGKRSESKKLKLFKLILSGKAKTDEHIASQLYEQRTCSAYSHLKKRLHEDILNIMLLSSTNQEEEDRIAEEIKCRKLLIQGKMLISRGVIDDGLLLLKDLSNRADKLEFHDIKLASDDVLRTYSDLRPNLGATRSYDRHINESFNIMRKILYAKQMNYEVRHPNENHTVEVHTYDIPLRPVRQQTDFGSEKLNYWYNKFAMGNSQQNKNFKQAESYANAILENIKQNPKLYSTEEMADIFLEVSNLNFRMERYNQATKYAKGAINYFKNQQNRKLEAMRIVFLSLFRKGEINQSWDLVNKVLNNANTAVDSAQAPIWILQKATLEFIEHHYSDSVKTLQSGYTQLGNKSDWMVGYRLVELLNILELHDYDWLEYKLEAFRKFVHRLHCASKERYTTIYKVFKKYIDVTGYERQYFSEYLNTIDQEQNNQTWDPMGVEIINVIGWFKEKLNSKTIHTPSQVN